MDREQSSSMNTPYVYVSVSLSFLSFVAKETKFIVEVFLRVGMYGMGFVYTPLLPLGISF